jgi:hypothetical protein
MWLPMECLSGDEIIEAKRALTVVPEKFEDSGDTEPIIQYEIDAKRRLFGVPAFWGRRLCKARGIPVREEFAPCVHIDYAKCPTPWEEKVPGQEQLFKDTLEMLKARNFVLTEAGMGTGKTATACYSIYHLATVAGIVVPTKGAADHWKEELVKHLGLKPSEIGMIGDGECDWEDKKVIIMLLHSASMKELPPGLFQRVAFVVFDEGHRLGARMFSRAIPRFYSRYRLTMTGTADRKDGCMCIVTNAFGKATAILGGESLPCDVRTAVYRRRFWGRTNPNDLPLAILVNILAKDNERNDFLAGKIDYMCRKGRDVLGIGDRIEQICVIRQILIQKFGHKPEDVGIYCNERIGEGGKREKIDAEERARVRRDCRVILATRGSMKEAVDVPRLKAGIDLTPIADAAQEIARIRRPSDDADTPVWLTVLDDNVGILRGFYVKRLRVWRELNCNIIDPVA